MLPGQMMVRPLAIPDIIDYAAEVHADDGLATAMPDGEVRFITYARSRERIARLASVLLSLGIGPGDRVATLAWNTFRHFEIYYATAGIGAVCHTINPRLPVEQIDYIMRHAGDSLLLFDSDLSHLVASIPLIAEGQIALVELADAGETGETLSYEALLADHEPLETWLPVPETAASGLCYTSGTTGHPKGALYSHRSTVLFALTNIASRISTCPLGGKFMPAVPMFHVNAWGMPYIAPLGGNGLVLPGNRLDGDSLFALMDRERVYCGLGVPTIWHGLLAAMERNGRKPEGLQEIIVGGSAASGKMIASFQEVYGVNVHHAWGMTEMSPTGTTGILKPGERELDDAARDRLQLSQGRRLFGVEMKIAGEDGTDLPKDGQTAGELKVRGNSVIASYFNNESADEAAFDDDGWFRTGDRARIGPDGRLMLVDRIKDLIKSGGEWISSIDMEEAAMRHPQVASCAAIGIADEKWGERPILLVVAQDDATFDMESLRTLLAGSLAKWQMPDEIVLQDSLPMNANGKVSKRELREKFAGRR